MANANFRLTLKNKILILLLCVVVTSNLVIGMISQKNSMKSMTTAVYQQLSYMSGGLSGQVAEICNRQFSILHILALLDTMRDPDISLAEKQSHLSSIINSYEGNYENLAFYDINGNAITADGRILNFGTREYFTTAISGKDFMSQPKFSTVTNSVLQHVSVPVYDFDGKILGAIVLVINGNIYLDLIKDIDLGGGMHPSIISRKTMQTVANSNEGVDENSNPEELDTSVGLGLILSKLFAGETGTEDFLDPTIGIHMITSYQPIPSTDWSVFAVAPYDYYFSSIKKLKLTTAILLIITIILSFVICSIFVRILVNPLKAVKDSIQDIASGNADLTQRLPIFNNDEIGDVVMGFNKFVEKLQNIVRNLLISKDGLASIGTELQDKTHDTSASITQIIANIESVNNMIANQSYSVTETAGAVNEISSNIESLERMIENQAAGVTQASSTIEEMIGNINSVNNAVEKMVDSFTNLEQNATYGMTTQNSANEQIEKIEEQSTLLQDANTAIANIAEQTNLLAMNAAIEAAHAGEAGKGFSVVADEIRKLSETSSEQSNTIGLELTKIQQTIRKIVDVTKITNSVFMTVSKNITETSQIIEQIRAAMNEQQVGSRQIIDALKTMNDSTSEVKIASSEMAAGNKQILDEIQRLQNSTDVINQSVKEMHIGARQINNTGAALTHISSQVTDNITKIVKEVGMFKV